LQSPFPVYGPPSLRRSNEIFVKRPQLLLPPFDKLWIPEAIPASHTFPMPDPLFFSGIASVRPRIIALTFFSKFFFFFFVYFFESRGVSTFFSPLQSTFVSTVCPLLLSAGSHPPLQGRNMVVHVSSNMDPFYLSNLFFLWFLGRLEIWSPPSFRSARSCCRPFLSSDTMEKIFCPSAPLNVQATPLFLYRFLPFSSLSRPVFFEQ